MENALSDMPTSRRFDNYTFDWEDVDIISMGICGGFKCFFQSRSDPQNVGYVVETRKGGMSFLRGLEAKSFGEGLQEQFPALKILAPWHVELRYMSADKARRLNSYLFSVKTDDFVREALYTEGNVTVYTVPAAPTPNYLMKNRLYYNKVARLVMEQTESNPDFDVTTWKENFSTSVKLILELFQAEPCLCGDFQVLLEIPTGHLWHIDLDRCFDEDKSNNKTETAKTTVVKRLYSERGLEKHLANLESWPQKIEGALDKLGILD